MSLHGVPWGLKYRNDLWHRLSSDERPWDLVIIGGGITGAGILREAARRGLKVLLVEQKDFAWGTSSRSSKMVHGGLRYVAEGEIRLTKEAVQERERFLQEVPGLVDPLGNVFLHFKRKFPTPFIFQTLLRLYDFFAGKKNRRYIARNDVSFWAPYARQEGLLGASQFMDAVTDDSRLVFRVLREAAWDGGDAINYVTADETLKQNGKVTGLRVTDNESGETCAINAKVVVSATGTWADQWRDTTLDSLRVRPLRGSHIVLPRWKLPVAQSIMMMHPKDKRPLFVFPWEGATVIGTTDLDHQQDLNAEAVITREEINYLFESVAYQFPGIKLSDKDVIATYAGVRPVVSNVASKGKGLKPSQERREHTIWQEPGLIAVSGGKLTTFRVIALDVLNAAANELNIKVHDVGSAVFQATPASAAPADLPLGLRQRVAGHYGPDLDQVISSVVKTDLREIDGLPTLWVELEWAVKGEMIVHLDDLLLRRTRLGLLLPQGGESVMARVKVMCQQHLGWDDAKWQKEVVRYRKLWAANYSLPQ